MASTHTAPKPSAATNSSTNGHPRVQAVMEASPWSAVTPLPSMTSGMGTSSPLPSTMPGYGSLHGTYAHVTGDSPSTQPVQEIPSEDVYVHTRSHEAPRANDPETGSRPTTAQQDAPRLGDHGHSTPLRAAQSTTSSPLQGSPLLETPSTDTAVLEPEQISDVVASEADKTEALHETPVYEDARNLLLVHNQGQLLGSPSACVLPAAEHDPHEATIHGHNVFYDPTLKASDKTTRISSTYPPVAVHTNTPYPQSQSFWSSPKTQFSVSSPHHPRHSSMVTAPNNDTPTSVQPHTSHTGSTTVSAAGPSVTSSAIIPAHPHYPSHTRPAYITSSPTALTPAISHGFATRLTSPVWEEDSLVPISHYHQQTLPNTSTHPIHRQSFSSSSYSDDLTSPTLATTYTVNAPYTQAYRQPQQVSFNSLAEGQYWSHSTQSPSQINTDMPKDKIQEPILAPGEIPATKPAPSYAALIGEALLASGPPYQLYVSEISEAIKRKYAYFRQNPSKVYNGVRHQTSMNQAFVKLQRPFGDQSGGARKWAIRDGWQIYFKPGAVYTPPPSHSGRKGGGRHNRNRMSKSKQLALGSLSPSPPRKHSDSPSPPYDNSGGPSCGAPWDHTRTAHPYDVHGGNATDELMPKNEPYQAPQSSFGHHQYSSQSHGFAQQQYATQQQQYLQSSPYGMQSSTYHAAGSYPSNYSSGGGAYTSGGTYPGYVSTPQSVNYGGSWGYNQQPHHPAYPPQEGYGAQNELSSPADSWRQSAPAGIGMSSGAAFDPATRQRTHTLSTSSMGDSHPASPPKPHDYRMGGQHMHEPVDYRMHQQPAQAIQYSDNDYPAGPSSPLSTAPSSHRGASPMDT